MLKRVKLSGFKSIREMDLELGPLNMLIGANGSGKSNLLALFPLLREFVGDGLQEYVGRQGGAHLLLHYGPRVTDELSVHCDLESGAGRAAYDLHLAFSPPDALVCSHEELWAARSGSDFRQVLAVGADPHTTRIWEARGGGYAQGVVLSTLGRCTDRYHFADTSAASRVRGPAYINDNRALASDAANLAAYLYMLRETRREYYERIVATIRLAAPFFGDFVLAPMELNPNNILLEWRERESDYLFGPHQLPDGLLRLMALVTLLRQPEDRLPSLIIIDEPELGLHPYALEIVVSLLESVSTHAQVIVATQSAPLVDMCDPETIVVVDRIEGRSEFRRLRPADLTEWLAEYSLGELWEKNVIGGVPSR